MATILKGCFIFQHCHHHEHFHPLFESRTPPSVFRSEDPKIATMSSWSLDCALHSLLLGSGWGAGVWVGMGGTKTDLIDCFVLKNVKVLTHNLADHSLYRTSQIHEVLAIIWCIFSGPHRRIPRIIFCEISVYLLVIQLSWISILLSPVFVSPSECFPLVFPEPFARFYSFLPKAHLRSSPHWSFAISSLLGLWKMWQKRILTPMKSDGMYSVCTGMCRWFSFPTSKLVVHGDEKHGQKHQPKG